MKEKIRQYVKALIEQKIMPIPECGCWIWPDGEQLNIDGYENTVERIVYETYRGSLRKGQKITHKCHLNCCMNPEHLSVDR